MTKRFRHIQENGKGNYQNDKENHKENDKK